MEWFCTGCSTHEIWHTSNIHTLVRTASNTTAVHWSSAPVPILGIKIIPALQNTSNVMNWHSLKLTYSLNKGISNAGINYLMIKLKTDIVTAQHKVGYRRQRLNHFEVQYLQKTLLLFLSYQIQYLSFILSAWSKQFLKLLTWRSILIIILIVHNTVHSPMIRCWLPHF